MPTIDLKTGAERQHGANAILRLENDADPRALADDIRAAERVALAFPTFKDGRAYSQARIIRQQIGFDGELIAEGEILPDQIVHMRRCGFTSADLAEDKLEAACAALEAAGPRYQAGDGDGVTIIERRRARRRVEEAA